MRQRHAAAPQVEAQGPIDIGDLGTYGRGRMPRFWIGRRCVQSGFSSVPVQPTSITATHAVPRSLSRPARRHAHGSPHRILAALRVREKAHTREGDAIAAARRRLPMVEVDAAATRYSKPTGRPAAAWKRWTTATRLWTSRYTDVRNHGKIDLLAGRSDAPTRALAAAHPLGNQTGRADVLSLSGLARRPGARMI
jgi:Bacterial protein of unknown function (DUF899)